MNTVDAAPSNAGSDEPEVSDSHTSDANVEPAASDSVPEVDGGGDPNVEPTLLPPLPTEPLVLDQQQLESCVSGPLPQAAPPAECEFCSEDLRACPVVTGVAAIDSYFRAVSDLGRDVDRLQVLQQYFIEQALMQLGREPGATIPEDVAFLKAAIAGGMDGKLEGGLTVEYAYPRCSTSVDALRPFALDCDRGLGSAADMRCAGTCNAASEQALECSAFSELTCRGSGPECPGSCVGECQMQAGTCAGECVGECELDGSVECPGECQGETDGGTCVGACVVHGEPCPGWCTGNCELSLPGTCDGACVGECSFIPASGECGAGEQTLCSAGAQEEVECQGTCDGSLKTKTSAECEATVEAFGALLSQCVVPNSWARYTLTAEVRSLFPEDDKQDFDARLQCAGQLIVSAATIGARASQLLKANQRLLAAEDVQDASFEIAFRADRETAAVVCGQRRLPASREELARVAEQLIAIAESSVELASLVE